MANFSPNGLTSLYSYSNSALAQAGIEEFPFPTTGGWNGFAGDVCAMNFFLKTPAAQVSSLVPIAPTGYVYPYPTLFSGNGGNAANINWIPILGVFVGFKYTPLGQSGLVIQSTNFISGTQIEPNTQVTAMVQTDIQNIYKIQASDTATHGAGVQQSALFTINGITADVKYQTTTGIAAIDGLSFPLGDTTPGGLNGSGGLSRSYLVVESVYAPSNIIPFCLMGVTNDSQFSPPATPNLYPNPWVKVRINTAMAATTQFVSTVMV